MPLTSGDAMLLAGSALLAFNLLLLLAGLLAPSLAVACEATAVLRSQVFSRKLAQQVSHMGLVTGVYSLLVAAGTAGFLAYRAPGPVWPALPADLLRLLAVAAGVWLVASLAHHLTWKALKESRTVHLLLGILAAVAGLATAIGLALVVAIALAPGATPLPPPHVPAGLALAAGLPAAALLAFAWVALRRNQDDWGRDYYVFAFRALALWGLAALLLGLAVVAGLAASHLWPLVAGRPAATLALWSGAAGAIVMLLAAALLVGIRATDTPLRLKFLVFLAATCLWLALMAMIFGGLVLGLQG